MTKTKSINKVNRDVLKFLQQPAIKIAEALTGILSSSRSDLILSAGRLVQASIKLRLFQQLGKELKEYREKGKIKDDFCATKYNQASLCELLKFIDEEVPDEERFKAMKSIFLTSVSKDASEDKEVLAYQMMQICRQLSGRDILVLKAIYDIASGGSSNLNDDANLATKDPKEWFSIVAHKIGHKIPSLVEISEERLVNLKLISRRIHPDRSGIDSRNFRLTQLGLKLCEFISRYE